MQEENRTAKTALIAGLSIAFIGALVAIFFLKASKPESVPAPSAYAPFTAPDKSFACLAPKDWETQSASAHAVMGGALFKSGPAKIDITSDLMGSLMGDIVTASNAQAESLAGMMPGGQLPAGMKTRPPVEQLHTAGKQALASRYGNYTEQTARPLRCSLGDARYSEWTADGGFMAGKQHGYRVTILGGERRITVVSYCPESNWPTLKPAFEKVIASLQSGGG